MRWGICWFGHICFVSVQSEAVHHIRCGLFSVPETFSVTYLGGRHLIIKVCIGSLLHVSIEPPQRISRYIVYANAFMKDECVCSLHRTYQILCISILNVFWLMQVALLPYSNGRCPMVAKGLPWNSAALVLFHCKEIGRCRRLSSHERVARKSCSRHWRRCIFSDLVLPLDTWILFQ